MDVNVVARLRNGLTMQGGTSTGRRLEDACAMKAALPEYGAGPNGANNSIAGNARPRTNPYCRARRAVQDGFRGLATYTIPRVDVQVSGTWSSTRESPRGELHGEQRDRRRRRRRSAANLSGGNVTVNLIEPNTLFADRRNNIDFRVAKIFRYGRTRTQIGVDIYNLTNTDVVTGLQPEVRPWRRVAGADGDSAGAVRARSARRSTSSRLRGFWAAGSMGMPGLGRA